MKSGLNIILLLILSNSAIYSQNDSILCGPNFKLNEGVYINYEDFRRNNPVNKEQIESNLNKEMLDFYGKVLESEQLAFVRINQKYKVISNTVWGFYQNNVLHINYKNKFYRVPLFGSICYLMASVEVSSPAFYPGYGGIGGIGGINGGVSINTKSREIQEFLINYYDGIIVPFSMKDAEGLLSRDSVVYNEFKSLKAKKRKEQISRYIRKYNELHPIYFLK